MPIYPGFEHLGDITTEELQRRIANGTAGSGTGAVAGRGNPSLPASQQPRTLPGGQRGNPMHEASDRRQRAADIAMWGWPSEEAWAAAGYPIGPANGRDPLAPGGGVNPQQAGAGGTAPTPDTVMQALIRGEISPEAAQIALRRLGQSEDVILRQIQAVRPGWTPAAGGGTGGNYAGTPSQGNVPTAQPQPVGGDFLSNMQAQPETIRRFALESGIAPNFQDMLQGFAGQQMLPFLVERLRAGQDPGTIRPEDTLGFLRQQGVGNIGLGRQGMVSQGLRGAADFLRARGTGGQYNPFQGTLNEELTNPGVGAEMFAPIISQLANAGGYRQFRGMGNATQDFLRNYLALNPNQFTSAEQFIDFAGQQGLI